MLSPEKRAILAELSKSAQGEVLREYLDEQMNELNDTRKCESWEDTLGRKHAIELIQGVFSFLEDKPINHRGKSQYM